MKKGIIGLVILLLCAFVYQASATDYYAQADAEITTATLWDTNPAGGGTDLTWASLANGDVLYANNHAITIENDIGSASVTATLTTAAGTGTAGGSFTFNINTTAAKTLYTNVTAGTTPGLIVTGEGAGADTTELTIIGAITGGSATAAYGVKLEHTLGNIIITGSTTGGSNATAYGIYSGSAGKFALIGDSTAVSAQGVMSASASIFTINGDCIGSSTNSSVGCACGGATGYAIISGNLSSGTTGPAFSGKCRWNPTAPSNGVNGHYAKFMGSDGSTAIYVGKNTETQSKALTDFYYFTSSSATSTVGTATTTGGGGAWGW